MSLKHTITKADYIQWEEALSLIAKLERDNKPKMALLIAVGIYTGLRISDILTLCWDMTKSGKWEIREKKTGKTRTITVHPQLSEILTRNQDGARGLIFASEVREKAISVQYINTELKRIARKYGLNGRISSHSLRKTFGRNVWEKNGKSDKALIMLSQVYGHANTQVTRIYLGIRDEEISDIYLNL